MKSDSKIRTNFLTAPFQLVRPLSIETIYTFFINEVTPEFYFDGEVHEPWEMVYVHSGEAGISADEKIFTLKKGQFVLHKPMEFHKIWGVEKKTKLLILSFDINGSRISELEKYSGVPSEPDIELMNRLLEQLKICHIPAKGNITDFLTRWNGSETELYLIINMLESIFLHLIDSPRRRPDSEAFPDSGLYKKMVEIMEQNVHSSLSIPQLADLCSVSPATAKNCFTRYAGCGIHKYFLKVKIRAAITLIQQGISIGEVSDQLGFNNPNYFSYVFKRETGRRPSDYKSCEKYIDF